MAEISDKEATFVDTIVYKGTRFYNQSKIKIKRDLKNSGKNLKGNFNSLLQRLMIVFRELRLNIECKGNSMDKH